MKIVAAQLGKRFNREWIFKNFDFSFKQGDCFAIVGPNGSGKSTLMQVLWGQVPPSKGAVSYFHDEINIQPEDFYRFLSIATPYMELIEEFTLQEMIQFHFKFKGILNGLSLPELMELMELDNARNKYISNFSSGMRQRLKLGLAFFSDSRVLFLDEPTTNLDKKAIAWYKRNLSKAMESRLVIIASNVEQEYPENAIKIDLMAIK